MGPHADFVRDILDTLVVDKLASDISWDTARANGYRGLATAIYCMSRWPGVAAAPSFTVLENWLTESDSLDEDLCDNVRETYEIFWALAKDEKLNQVFWLPGVKNVAPIEFLAISLLIFKHKSHMTMAQLSEAIGLMRHDIRKEEKDIRQNSRLMKQVLGFVKNLKVSDVKKASGRDSVAGAAISDKKGKKRKRMASDSAAGKLSSATYSNRF